MRGETGDVQKVQLTLQDEALVLDYVATQNRKGFAVSAEDTAEELQIPEALASAWLAALHQRGILRCENDFASVYYQLSDSAWGRLGWLGEEGYF